MMKAGLCLTLVAAVGSAASAGLTSANMSAVDVSSLTLPADNAWTGGYGTRTEKNNTNDIAKDWGFVAVAQGASTDSIWLDEVWTGPISNPATLDVTVDTNPGFNVTTINISKKVDNQTGFDWTGFTMTLSTLNGNVNVVQGPSSDKFNSPLLQNNNSNTVTMNFSNGVVAQGDDVTFNFKFEIPISGLWTFTITQTPVPAPGAFAIAGIAGLAGLRRRR
jgi:MYXO-CTERM domain-containing protein